MYYTLDDFEVEGFDYVDVDVCGREFEKTQLLANKVDKGFNNLLVLSLCPMYLITGPVGYGKAHLAQCCAQTMKRDADYRIFRIDCENLMDEDEPEEIWKSILDEIIENTSSDIAYGYSACLYLENLSAVGENRKFTKKIADSLKKMKDEDCRCVVYATELDAATIPAIILKYFSILELSLPKEMERAEFFAQSVEFSVEDVSNGDFSFDFENSEEANMLTFYPFEVEKGKDEGSDVTELDRVALYCAKKTEGLSFGELARVVEDLSRTLKKKFLEITNDVGGVAALVKNGQDEKGYVLSEEDFLEIVANVKHAGEILLRAQSIGMRVGNEGAIPVMSQPQVIYVNGQPGMGQESGFVQQGMPQQGYGRNNGYNQYRNQSKDADEMEQLLNNLDENDPDIGTMMQIFGRMPKAKDVDKYVNSEN